MHDRCTNPKNSNYHRYGGRGIKVCARWDDYRAFLADMGERPQGTTLDRRNNDGDYELSNCRWATKLQQANNTSTNRVINILGHMHTMSEWSRIADIGYGCLKDRLTRGWDPYRAITIPVRRHGA